MQFDWLPIIERVGFPIAAVIWLLLESRASRKAGEKREAKAQLEAHTRETDLAKRLREIEDSRLKELKLCQDGYVKLVQDVTATVRDMVSQLRDAQRAIRLLYQHLRTTCAPSLPTTPPRGEDASDGVYNPHPQPAQAQAPDNTSPSKRAPTKRRSSPEIPAPPKQP